MSYLALYRKYRPSSFDDLVGQSKVANIIKSEILNNKLSHAYLFSGPRGTGKTSSAKIIAKMINCSNLGSDGLPCGKCDSCLNFSSSSDVVEIDAASNNGVDEIRNLRDKVNLVPTFGKYKIYIIDEVHMLTTQAFNALLKTLEEPPAHIVFILATTEFHKIPVTVVSRCQKFQFFKFSNEDIVKRLLFISKQEKITVDKDVLYEIARLSDGGMRDAINMLDQLSSYNSSKISVDDVYLLNGVLSYDDFSMLLKYIYNGKVLDVINIVENIDKSGKSFDRFIADLVNFLKDILIVKVDSNYKFDNSLENEKIDKVVDLFDENFIYDFIIKLNDLSIRMKTSSFGKILVVTELIKISNLLLVNKNKLSDNDKNSKNHRDVNIDSDANLKSSINLDKFIMNDKLKMIRINNAFATASKKYKDDFVNNWNVLLDKLISSEKYSSISLIMSDVEVLVVGENNVIFLAPYESLLDRLTLNLNLIEKLLFDVYNIKYKCVFLLSDEWNFEKNKYIENLKNGYKYQYIEEETQESINDGSDDIDMLVSILGNDVISYE